MITDLLCWHLILLSIQIIAKNRFGWVWLKHLVQLQDEWISLTNSGTGSLALPAKRFRLALHPLQHPQHLHRQFLILRRQFPKQPPYINGL